MSKFAKLLAGLLLAGCVSFAQDAATPAPSAPASGQDRDRHDSADKRLKRLGKRLSLTDEQKEKAKPILEDEQKQVAALDSDSTLNPQQKRKKIRQIRMSSRSQLDAILTPEQREKVKNGQDGGGRHHQRSNQTGTSDTGSSTSQ